MRKALFVGAFLFALGAFLFDLLPLSGAPLARAQTVNTGVLTGVPDMASLDQFDALVLKKSDYYLYFLDWDQDLDPTFAQALIDRGTIPTITWEPFNRTLVDIAGGRHDRYIRQQASNLKQVTGTVLLRPMHEMNGHWYPWGYGVNGNTPEDYVAAFRHIVDVFRAQGADNVQFVWSPNNEGPPVWNASTIPLFYPGDAYVDYAAVSGYNWGDGYFWVTTGAFSSWLDFDDIFFDAYGVIAGTSGKPILIAETASNDLGGSKSGWITNAFDKVRTAYPRVVGLNWFHAIKEVNWRVDSSAASLAAYRAAVDTVAPSGSVTVNGGAAYANKTAVTLNLAASDNASGVTSVRFMNDDSDSWSDWQSYSSTKSWTLTAADGTRKVSAQFRDAGGNLSAVDDDAIFLDRQPPTQARVSATSHSVWVSTNASFPVSWSASDPSPSSGLTYTVWYRAAPSSTWVTWRSGVTGTSATFTGSAGKTYYFMARAIDSAGNGGGYSAQAFTVVPYDNTQATYSSAWVPYDGSDYFWNTIRCTSRSGGWVSIGVTGSVLHLVVQRGPGRGRATIYVDGAAVSTIDTYATTYLNRQVIYLKTVSNANHTVKVVNLASPGRPYLCVDGFAVKR